MKETLVTLIDEERIKWKVEKLARIISFEYRKKTPVLIGVLNGASIFMADLSRKLTMPIRVEFIKVSSYGKGTTSSQKSKIVSLAEGKIKGEDLVIVEDIVDTGATTRKLVSFLKELKPRSIKICSLLDKKDCRKIPINIDYVGFEVPDKFLVGYGLDYRQCYRNLPYIAYMRKARK